MSDEEKEERLTPGVVGTTRLSPWISESPAPSSDSMPRPAIGSLFVCCRLDEFGALTFDFSGNEIAVKPVELLLGPADVDSSLVSGPDLTVSTQF